MNNIKSFLEKILKPKSEQEDKARQEYILNILLVTIIFLISLGSIISFYKLIFADQASYQSDSLSLILILAILTFFVSLYFLSRRGYNRTASSILLVTLFMIATYMGYKWGIDLPAEILFYVLVIVISGILVGTKLAFTATVSTTLVFIIIGHLQRNNIILSNRSWVNEPWGYSDIIMSSVILFIIAIVSWLFNHDLEKSLKRAKESEAALKAERDNLEIRVAEKTQELKRAQAKEIAQVYRFAEFGKLSSGLFHDLVNPLTTVMLNVKKIEEDSKNHPEFNFITSDLEQVSKASERMKEFINSVRKQISPQGKSENFCLNQEVEEAIQVLNYKSKKDKIQIIFYADKKIVINGDPIKFNQIVTNLISNAIDAFDNFSRATKEIIINLKQETDSIELEITDNGKGIPDNDIDKIFEPFFTTKAENHSLGLGLPLIKKMVEEDFSGKINVSSQIDNGTNFCVSLPLK